jgi:hypothetical protein
MKQEFDKLRGLLFRSNMQANSEKKMLDYQMLIDAFMFVAL